MKNMNSINELSAQTQWVTGKLQLSEPTRVLFDFNNNNNYLTINNGVLPLAKEVATATQESTFCDPETGRWVIFFNGVDIYDGLENKLNPVGLNTADDSYFTSIIAPAVMNGSDGVFNVFFVEGVTLTLNAAMVKFENGFENKASWKGIQYIRQLNIPTPLGLACVSASEYWLLSLQDIHTLVAYQFNTNSWGSNVVHIPLQPFISLTGSVDCLTSSIVVHKNKIAITINKNIMIGELDYSEGFGICPESQFMVAESTSTIMPAFDMKAERLLFLKPVDAYKKNHVWVYENGCAYSVDFNHTYNNSYITLKLSIGGVIYGTNEFLSSSTLLSIDFSESNIILSEIVTDTTVSSATFGNNQYEVKSASVTSSKEKSGNFNYQDKWFPGKPTERYIYDFSSGVLKIEQPGFPLVTNDSDSIGNVITNKHGQSFYIIGKNLVDQNYKVVTGSDGLFYNTDLTRPNCVFAPDITDYMSTMLYYIDATGLKYVHISQNDVTGPGIDAIEAIILDYQPVYNSPLSIVGNEFQKEVLLFYITELSDDMALIVLGCNQNNVRVVCQKTIPRTKGDITIDIFENNISLLYHGRYIIMGSINHDADDFDIDLLHTINQPSPWLISCAFSLDKRYFLYTTYIKGQNFVNYIDMSNGRVSSQKTVGCYTTLKLGPDGNVYGLSKVLTSEQQSTYLLIVPINTPDVFSISEVYTSINGGRYPNTEYRNITPFIMGVTK